MLCYKETWGTLPLLSCFATSPVHRKLIFIGNIEWTEVTIFLKRRNSKHAKVCFTLQQSSCFCILPRNYLT